MPRVSSAKSEPPVVVNVATQSPAPTFPSAETKAELEPNWFFDRLANIPPEDWQKIYTLEIHRKEPNLPGVPGSKGFLEVYTEPVTKGQIKARFGGGKFSLVLLKNGKYVTSHTFDIEGDPIYLRGRELPPDGASSGMESRLLNMLESNLKEMKEELRTRQANGQSDPALEKAINMLSTSYSTALDTVQKEKANPTQLLKDLVGTAKELGVLGPPAAPANHLESNLLNKLIEAAIPLLLASLKPKTLAEQVAEFEAMEKILGGGRDGRPKDWKATLADRLGEAVPTILERIQQPPARRPGAAPARPFVQPNGAAPAAPQPGNVVAARPQVRTPPPPPAPTLRVVPQTSTAGNEAESATSSSSSLPPADSPAVEVLPADQQAQLNEEMAYVRGVKRRIVRSVKQAVGDGEDGARIVDFLETAWPEAVNQIEMFSAAQITEFFGEDEILRQAVQDERWPGILAEAQAYAKEDVSTAR